MENDHRTWFCVWRVSRRVGGELLLTIDNVSECSCDCRLLTKVNVIGDRSQIVLPGCRQLSTLLVGQLV